VRRGRTLLSRARQWLREGWFVFRGGIAEIPGWQIPAKNFGEKINAIEESGDICKIFFKGTCEIF